MLMYNGANAASAGAGQQQEGSSQYTHRVHSQASNVKSQPQQQRITQGATQRRIAHKMTLGDSSSEVFCTKFDPEDRYIATGYGDGNVRIYNLETAKLAFTLHGSQFEMDNDMPITCMRWRPQSKQLKTMNVLVTAQADGSLKHWHATSGKCLHARCDEPENHLYAIDFSPDGGLLATAGRDTYVRIYDESTKSLTMKLKEKGEQPGHSNRIFCVKFNHLQPNQLISGGWDNTMQIYDIREKGPVASIYGPHICGESLDFRNDGYTVLAGSYRHDDAL